MQVFNLFFKILKKHSKAVVLYILIFLGIAFAIVSNDNTEKKFIEATLDVAIFDEDNTPASRALYDMIASKHNIKEIENDRDKITDLLYWEEINYVLVIKDGFSENLAAGRTEGLFEEYRVHDSYSVHYMSNILDEYVKTSEAYIAAGKTADDAAVKAAEVLSKDTEVEYLSAKAEGTPEYSNNFSSFFQYLPYIIISGLCYSVSIILIVINRKDVRFRTDCSSVSAKNSTMQLFAATGVFVLVIWMILMIAGMVLYGGIYEGRAWFAVLNSLAFTFFAAAFAVFLSSLDLGDNAVNILAQVVGMGMAFFCGVFVPQEVLGSGVLSAARFMPAYWYIRLNDSLVERNGLTYSTGSCFGYLGIQLCFGIVFVVLTLIIRRSKRNESTS